jgi:hypothetical protein
MSIKDLRYFYSGVKLSSFSILVRNGHVSILG